MYVKKKVAKNAKKREKTQKSVTFCVTKCVVHTLVQQKYIRKHKVHKVCKKVKNTKTQKCVTKFANLCTPRLYASGCTSFDKVCTNVHSICFSVAQKCAHLCTPKNTHFAIEVHTKCVCAQCAKCDTSVHNISHICFCLLDPQISTLFCNRKHMKSTTLYNRLRVFQKPWKKIWFSRLAIFATTRYAKFVQQQNISKTHCAHCVHTFFIAKFSRFHMLSYS